MMLVSGRYVPRAAKDMHGVAGAKSGA